jgi:hypothetical protein
VAAIEQTKSRWWSPRPAPVDTPVISARRAYLEVLGVFAIFFAASIAAAAFYLGNRSPSVNIAGWSDAVPAGIDQVATTALCILVPVLLVRRRGLGPGQLGLTKPGTVSVSQGIRIAAWALLAFIVGSIVTSALATGSFDEGTFSYPNLTVNLLAGAQAGFLEEIVVLAFVITTLEQARRPRAEIVIVAVLLRASYHIYYGPGVLGILIWAPVFVWLYLRFRTIVPLIIVHSCWDMFIMLSSHWKFVSGLDVLSWLALFVTAFVLWLVERSARRATPPPGWYPPSWPPGPPWSPLPGWYPDPGGTPGYRWFDGRGWTALLHGAPGRDSGAPQPTSVGIERRDNGAV